MSIDRSLKSKGSLTRHRNVLNRSERIERLKSEDRWEEGDELFGLPKVANRKVSVGKKTKDEKAAADAAATDTAAAAAAPVAGAKPGAKAAAPGAKPAAGAKAATPAAKPAAGAKAAGGKK
jgi:small basic protein (TIGR04137 family)